MHARFIICIVVGNAAHGSVCIESYLAIQTVPAQIHQPAAAIKHPFLYAMKHLACPIFRVNGKNEDFISIERKGSVMKLRFCVVIVFKPLALQPAEQAPFSRSLPTLNAALD